MTQAHPLRDGSPLTSAYAAPAGSNEQDRRSPGIPPALLRRRETIAESMRPPTSKYLTAAERDSILRRLELVDMLIRDHGAVDHSTHEWCDAREGCGPDARVSAPA